MVLIEGSLIFVMNKLEHEHNPCPDGLYMRTDKKPKLSLFMVRQKIFEGKPERGSMDERYSRTSTTGFFSPMFAKLKAI